MRAPKSTILPLFLGVYLAVMAYIGYPGYCSGETSALKYYGIIAVTLLVIIILHFSLKRREKLKRERENDIKNNKTKTP